MNKNCSEAGSLKNIKEIVHKLSVKKILIVTGKKLFSLSGAQSKINQILGGIEIIVFNDF